MRLKDICVLDAVCCPPDTSIEAAAREMRKRHVGDLIVVDDGDEEREPIGIVTDRDIVLEVVALGRDPAKVKVSEIMSNNVVVAAASEEVRVALERMTMHGVRRIPILDDAGFVLGRGFTLWVRGGYQARISRSGGPAAGATLQFGF